MTKQQSTQGRVSCASMLIALTVITLFSCSQKALAQQWNTSGNDISNTNSGNVGVGTTSPGVKLDILSSVSLIARFGSSAGAHSQVLIDAPAGFNSNLTLQRGGVSKWFMGNRASNDRLSFMESTGVGEILTLLQDGKVGIGTNSPVYSLDVNGGVNSFRARASSTLSNDVIATFENASAIQAIVRANGNVGLGTVNPDARLSVVGAGATLPTTYTAGTVATFVTPADGSSSISLVKGGITNPQGLHFGVNQTWLYSEIQSIQNGLAPTDLLLNRVGGNVGIGTSDANYRLDVQGGTINSSGGLCIAGDCKTAWSQVGGSGAVTTVFGRTGAVVAATNDYTWAQINKSTSSLGDLQTRSAADLNAGTVPLARLGLSGTASTSTFLRGDNTWAPVPSSQWTSGTNNISYSSGNVGIGTASPGSLLDVSGSTNNPFRVRDSSGREYFSTTTRSGPFAIAPVVTIAGRLIIDNTGPDGGNETIVRRPVNSLILKPSDHPDLPGAFMVQQAGGSTILYAGQNASGNVGIGTTTPSAKLEVAGNISVTGTGNITAAGTIEGGNVKAKYQDVAEWVESSQELLAGTLVVLDHTKSNQVIASSQAYDTRVAGVISERPGITLGEGGANKVLVATTGRVRVTVDASKGPIQIGDLLVASDIPGVAMKSEAINVGGVQIHRPGTLVGKALEPLAKGQGKILVLLSLQ